MSGIIEQTASAPGNRDPSRASQMDATNSLKTFGADYSDSVFQMFCDIKHFASGESAIPFGFAPVGILLRTKRLLMPR